MQLGLAALLLLVPTANAGTLTLATHGPSPRLENVQIDRIELEFDRTFVWAPLTLGSPTYTASLQRKVDAGSALLEQALFDAVTYPTLTISFSAGGPGRPTVLTLTNARFVRVDRLDDGSDAATERLELTLDAYAWTTP